MSFLDKYFGHETSGDQTRYTGGVQVTKHTRQDGGDAVKVGRLRALWDGSSNGTNLASPMAYVPVSVVRSLVGCPIIISDDNRTQEKLNEIRRQYLVDEAPIITQSTLITGTAWRWPQWDNIGGKWYIEAIADDEVSGFRQMENGEIAEMWLDKKVGYRRPDSRLPFPTTYRLQRHITRDYIDIVYSGATNKTERRLNYFREFPIPFGHDCYETEWRGNSVYGRSWRTLKFYHDVQYKIGQILAKFNPKQVQTLIDRGPDTATLWRNERYASNGVDVLDDELIINLIDQAGHGTEQTEFKFLPSDSIMAYMNVLDRLQKQAQWGSGLPEIFFPTALTGNMASAAYQTQQGVDAIKSVRREQTAPYEKCLRSLLNVIGYVDGYRYGDFRVSWDEFDMVTQTERAQIFSTFSGGLATLINANAMTKEMAVYFTKLFYRDLPHKTADELAEAMKEWFTDVKDPMNVGMDAGDFGGLGDMGDDGGLI
jgi:hypothetical protein